MDVAAGEIGAGEPLAMLLRHLDEIAEHVVVADLERLDAGLLGIAACRAAITWRLSSRSARMRSSSSS